MTLYDVPAALVIEKMAEDFKKIEELQPPMWSLFVKTGGNREKMPENKDWWYVRSAAILRKVYTKGPIGIHTLGKAYGGKKNRGVKPERKMMGSGAIIRKILQQLEAAGLVKKTKKGRITTPNGVATLDKTANRIKKTIPELDKY